MTNKIVVEIRKRVIEKLDNYGLGGSGDAELADYIMIMVVNRRSSETMIADLSVFLTDKTHEFVAWIQKTIKSLMGKDTNKDKEKDKDTFQELRRKKADTKHETLANSSRSTKKDIVNIHQKVSGLSPGDRSVRPKDDSSDRKGATYSNDNAPDKKTSTFQPPITKHADASFPTQDSDSDDDVIVRTAPKQNIPSLTAKANKPPPRSTVGAIIVQKCSDIPRPTLSSAVVVKRRAPASPPTHRSNLGCPSELSTPHLKRSNSSANLFKRSIDDVQRSSDGSKRKRIDRESEHSSRRRTRKALDRSFSGANESDTGSLDPKDLRHRLGRNRSRDPETVPVDADEEEFEWVYQVVDSEEANDEGVESALAGGYSSADEICTEHDSGTVVHPDISDLVVSSSIELDSDHVTPMTSTKPISAKATDTKSVDSESKNKLKIRCRFWPSCVAGKACKFYHPTACTTFPHCKFGSECLFLHPLCSFDSVCKRPNCIYSHSAKASGRISGQPLSHRSLSTHPPTYAPSVTSQLAVCRFHPACTNPACKFFHPRQDLLGRKCRFAAECNNPSCSFLHPGEQAVSGRKSSWV